MLKRLVAIAVIMLIALTTVGFAVDQPNEPNNANAMWIEPSSVDLRGQPIGHLFNVTVWLNVTGYSGSIGGWQYKLIYNDASVNIVSYGYTNATLNRSQFFENITTQAVTPVFAAYDATHRSFLWGESWLSGTPRGSGYGSLTWIEFNLTGTPAGLTTFNLDLSTAQGTHDTYVLNFDTLDEIPLTAYNATVTIPEFTIAAYLVTTLIATSTLTLLTKKSFKKRK
jgi:hypothetical protein